MINVIARIKVKPGKMAEFLKIFQDNVPAVRAEDGCIAYTPCLDAQTELITPNENIMTVVESWESIDHLKAHLAAPHMKQYGEAVKDLRDSTELIIVQPV